MKIQISKWLVISTILLIASFAVGAIIGFHEGVRKEHQIAIVQIAEAYTAGYDRGYQEAWRVGYDKGWTEKPPVYIDREVIKYIEKVEYKYYPVYSSNITAEGVLALLAEAKRSHQHYIDYPNEQNYWTGDTPFNRMWVYYYTSIEDFVKWEANRIHQLGRVEAYIEAMARLPRPEPP
mgnify:CR=1 FL=1